MRIDGPWLYFVWSGIAAYGALLCRALWRRRQQDPSFVWLLAAIVTAIFRQALIAAWATQALQQAPRLMGLTFPLQLLFLSFCAIFARGFTRQHDTVDQRELWLFVPPLLGLGWYFVLQAKILEDTFEYDSAQVMYPTPLNWARVILLLLFGLYVIGRARRDIVRFKTDARHHLSNLVLLRAPLLQTLWISTVIATLLPALDFVTGPNVQLWPLMPVVTVLSLFVLTQYALDHSRLFHVEGLKPPPKDRLRPDELAQIEERVRKAIATEQLYLNPEFRLVDLAEHIGIKPYKVSATLSGALNTNFFDFINGYRIEHAKRLMASQEHNHLNLVGIAMDSGFNSKSTFNETFKRVTGLTPSEYRRRSSEFARSDDQHPI